MYKLIQDYILNVYLSVVYWYISNLLDMIVCGRTLFLGVVLLYIKKK